MEILSDEQYNLYYDNKETEIKFIKNIGTLRKQSITNFIVTVFDIFSQNKERYLWLRQIKKKNNRVSSVTYYKFLACFKSLEAFIQSKDDVFLIDYTFVLGENMNKEGYRFNRLGGMAVQNLEKIPVPEYVPFYSVLISEGSIPTLFPSIEEKRNNSMCIYDFQDPKSDDMPGFNSRSGIYTSVIKEDNIESLFIDAFRMVAF